MGINRESEYLILHHGNDMAETLRRMAREIVAGNPELDALMLLGILTRGRPLADRLAGLIEDMTGRRPPVGSLATTLYRDDVRAGFKEAKASGQTHFDFDIDGATVVLIDDVLAAGRTIRAAMDEVMDYGRPKRIQLACLVDRGGRELPIQPDYLGFQVAPPAHHWILVRMKEQDGEDAVLEERREKPQEAEGV